VQQVALAMDPELERQKRIDIERESERNAEALRRKLDKRTGGRGASGFALARVAEDETGDYGASRAYDDEEDDEEDGAGDLRRIKATTAAEAARKRRRLEVEQAAAGGSGSESEDSDSGSSSSGSGSGSDSSSGSGSSSGSDSTSSDSSSDSD
jgi:hypothetical protein